MNSIKTLLVALLILGGSGIYAQQPIPSDSKKMGDAYKSPVFTSECIGERNEPGADLQLRAILTPKIIAFEPESPDHDKVSKIKSEKLKLKQGFYNQEKTTKGVSAITPVMNRNFAGNTNNGSSPMDNSIAVSNGGYIVSVANTTIQYLDMNGNSIYFNDIVTFLGDPTITNVCDPVVIYDPQEDRFVFFAQECSGTAANSQLLIFFSKTNNPSDGWWYYKITGNPLNDNSWFDYPKLAVSNNELYITGNLFYTGNNNFNRAVLYQIDKSTGYSGSNLAWQYWHSLNGNPFTLCPVSHGQGGSYGPGCYLVATDASGSSTVRFYWLTDDIGGSPTINYYPISTTAYSPAANSQQLGTSCLLDIGDCRTLSGFYLDGYVHFVFHSDVGNGWNGINYNRLNVSTGVNTSSMFGLAGSLDCSFPSVSSFSTSPTDKSVMIGFGTSSSSSYPEIRVVNCDDAMNWSSSTVIKTSDSYVTYTNPTKERWGDYTGTARKHNSTSPSIWMNGMYGTSTNVWNTWIAEVSGSVSTSVEDEHENTDAKVFPNPVIETFNLEFTLAEPTSVDIQLLDMSGKTIRNLYNGNAQSGINVFSFNKAAVSKGMYFLTVRSSAKLIVHETLVVH